MVIPIATSKEATAETIVVIETATIITTVSQVKEPTLPTDQVTKTTQSTDPKALDESKRTTRALFPAMVIIPGNTHAAGLFKQSRANFTESLVHLGL